MYIACNINIALEIDLIEKTLLTIAQCTSLEEINTLNFAKKMKKVLEMTGNYCHMKFDMANSKATIASFLKGEPVKALQRIEDLRKQLKDLDSIFYFTLVYCWLLRTIMRCTNKIKIIIEDSDTCMVGRDFCIHFMNNGGVEIILNALNSEEFKRKRDAQKREAILYDTKEIRLDQMQGSFVATAIGYYMVILLNLFEFEPPTKDFEQRLAEANFQKILEIYVY